MRHGEAMSRSGQDQTFLSRVGYCGGNGASSFSKQLTRRLRVFSSHIGALPDRIVPQRLFSTSASSVARVAPSPRPLALALRAATTMFELTKMFLRRRFVRDVKIRALKVTLREYTFSCGDIDLPEFRDL